MINTEKNTRNTRSERKSKINNFSLDFHTKKCVDLRVMQNVNNPNKKDSNKMTEENTTATVSLYYNETTKEVYIAENGRPYHLFIKEVKIEKAEGARLFFQEAYPKGFRV